MLTLTPLLHALHAIGPRARRDVEKAIGEEPLPAVGGQSKSSTLLEIIEAWKTPDEAIERAEYTEY